jgi:DNA-binding GntR family transcriptional regulator
MTTGGGLRRSGLTEQTYELFKERIIDGDLAPGQRLNIDALARELAVSNIPVREALARLAAEKLVVGEPFKGYTVMPLLTADRFNALYDTRLLLETYAARVAATRLHGAGLEQMAALVARMESLRVGPTYHEFKAFTVCDHDFHSLIVAGSENVVLAEIYEGLSPHIQLSRLYPGRGGVDSEEGAREHHAILAAFMARDPAAAVAAVETHIAGARRRLGDSLGRSNGLPAAVAR